MVDKTGLIWWNQNSVWHLLGKKQFFSQVGPAVWCGCGRGLLIWSFSPCRYCRTPMEMSFSLCPWRGGWDLEIQLLDGIYSRLTFSAKSTYSPPQRAIHEPKLSPLVPFRHSRTPCSTSSCCPRGRQLFQKSRGNMIQTSPACGTDDLWVPN